MTLTPNAFPKTWGVLQPLVNPLTPWVAPGGAILDYHSVNITGTTLEDESGSNNDGVLEGSGGNLPEKVVGGGPNGIDSLELKRDDSERVDIVANGIIVPSNVKAFTVSYWVKDDTAGYPSWSGVHWISLIAGGSPSQYWKIESFDGPAELKVTFDQVGATNQTCTVATTRSTSLRHIVFIYDRQTLQASISVDGSSGTPTTILDADLDGSRFSAGQTEAYMGGSASGANFPGEISGARWYDRRLTPIEIQQLANETPPP